MCLHRITIPKLFPQRLQAESRCPCFHSVSNFLSLVIVDGDLPPASASSSSLAQVCFFCRLPPFLTVQIVNFVVHLSFFPLFVATFDSVRVLESTDTTRNPAFLDGLRSRPF